MASENPPSDKAILERSRSLANYAMWAVKLQERRILSDEPEDKDFILRKSADFNFLFVSLCRLKRAVEISLNVNDVKSDVKNALKIFDKELASLLCNSPLCRVCVCRHYKIEKNWFKISIQNYCEKGNNYTHEIYYN